MQDINIRFFILLFFFNSGEKIPIPSKIAICLFGVLAQLVERNDGIVEVSGSIPLHSISYTFAFILVFS